MFHIHRDLLSEETTEWKNVLFFFCILRHSNVWIKQMKYTHRCARRNTCARCTKHMRRDHHNEEQTAKTDT